MITEFFIYSRPHVEIMHPHEVPHVIVSITSPRDVDANLRMNENTLGIVRQSFWDANAIIPGHEEFMSDDELFQRSHAREILDLVMAHPDAQRFIVHCDAGYSRSPAVAAALSKILLGDDEVFFKRYRPNSRVYSTILEVHHETTCEEQHHGDDHH